MTWHTRFAGFIQGSDDENNVCETITYLNDDPTANVRKVQLHRYNPWDFKMVAQGSFDFSSYDTFPGTTSLLLPILLANGQTRISIFATSTTIERIIHFLRGFQRIDSSVEPLIPYLLQLIEVPEQPYSTSFLMLPEAVRVIGEPIPFGNMTGMDTEHPTETRSEGDAADYPDDSDDDDLDDDLNNFAPNVFAFNDLADPAPFPDPIEMPPWRTAYGGFTREEGELRDEIIFYIRNVMDAPIREVKIVRDRMGNYAVDVWAVFDYNGYPAFENFNPILLHRPGNTGQHEIIFEFNAQRQSPENQVQALLQFIQQFEPIDPAIRPLIPHIAQLLGIPVDYNVFPFRLEDVEITQAHLQNHDPEKKTWDMTIELLEEQGNHAEGDLMIAPTGPIPTNVFFTNPDPNASISKIIFLGLNRGTTLTVVIVPKDDTEYFKLAEYKLIFFQTTPHQRQKLFELKTSNSRQYVAHWLREISTIEPSVDGMLDQAYFQLDVNPVWKERKRPLSDGELGISRRTRTERRQGAVQEAAANHMDPLQADPPARLEGPFSSPR